MAGPAIGRAAARISFQIARNLLRDRGAGSRAAARISTGRRRTTNPPRWKARRPGRASVSNSSSVSATWRPRWPSCPRRRSGRPAQVRRPVPGRSGRAHGNLPEHGGKAHRQRLAALQAAAARRRRMKPLERLEPLFADETEEDIDHRAAYWFSRRRSGHFSAACRAELEDWLRADPRHREALRGHGRLWREFDGLPRPALDDIPEPVPAWRLPGRWRRRSSCSARCSSPPCSGATSRSDRTSPTARHLASSARVVLADGSKLFLDVDTQVQVRYAERTRDVLLKARCSSWSATIRPGLSGSAAASRVTVLGTQFSVRRNAQALAVAVKQGRVALQPSLEKDAEHVLLAGDSARLDLAEQRLELGHVAPGRSPVGAMGNWCSATSRWANWWRNCRAIAPRRSAWEIPGLPASGSPVRCGSPAPTIFSSPCRRYCRCGCSRRLVAEC